MTMLFSTDGTATRQTGASRVLPPANPEPSPATIDLLLRRRSLVVAKQCEPGPTPDEIEVLLRCATRVPDHAKLTPWRIQVVQGEAQTRLGELFVEIFRGNNPDATHSQLAFERVRPCRAPLLLIVSTHITSDRIPRWEQILSGAAVCQNLLIAATALGYASQWLSEWPAYDPAVKQALNIAPEDEVLGLIYIGSAAEKPDERPRPELTQVVDYL